MSQHIKSPSVALTATNLRQPILCARTAVVLGTLEVTIVEGSLPFVQTFTQMQLVHPFFNQSEYHLLRKMQESLEWFNSMEWYSRPDQVRRIQILMSALMHKLNCIKQEFPTVPSFPICAGSATRLYQLANWYFNQTSRRIVFPLFSVATRNENTNWENFRYWLDTATEIKTEWETKARKYEREEELALRDDALREIKSEHSRRVDIRKIWSWIELQLAEEETSGRIVTYKSLFMSGDLEPENWSADDVDDVVFAIEENCDTGNPIMFYIRNRLAAIREHINDFYGSFTVVNMKLHSGEVSEAEKTKEIELFDSYDKKVEVLDTLPSMPQQKDFATLGLFLKAKAQWQLLKGRFELRQSRTKTENLKRNADGSFGPQTEGE